MTLAEYQSLMNLKERKARETRSKDKECLGRYLLFGGLPWRTEYRFHPQRRWRADWALLREGKRPILVEYEGAVFQAGISHSSGVEYSNDCEKYAQASILGFIVIRVTAKMVGNGIAFQLIEQALNAE